MARGIFTGLVLLFGEFAARKFQPMGTVEVGPLVALYALFGAGVGLVVHAPLARRPLADGIATAALATFFYGSVLLYRETGFIPDGGGGIHYLKVLAVASGAGILAGLPALLARRRDGPAVRAAGFGIVLLMPLFIQTYIRMIRLTGSQHLDLNAVPDAPILAAAAAVVGLFTWLFRRHRLGDLAAPGLAAAALFALAASSSTQVSAKPAAREDAPNIIVLVCDAARADHFGFHGYERSTSPTFDRLAESSTVYLRALASSPVSALSIPSMWTATEPAVHRGDWRRALASPAETLPGWLRTRFGYHTGCMVWEEGFENTSGLENQVFDDFRDAPPGLFSSIGSRPDQWSVGILAAALLGGNVRSIDLGSHETNRRWNEQLRDFVDAAPGDRPFFLFAHDLRTHIPINVFPESGPVWGTPLAPESFKHFWSLWAKSTGRRLEDRELTAAELAAFADYRDRYDDALRSFDDSIAELIDYLERRSLAGKTILIITSDHGEPLGDENIRVRTTRDITLGSIWTPLLIHDPRNPQPRRLSAPVTSASLPGIIRGLVETSEFVHAEQVATGDPVAPYATDGRHIAREGEGSAAWIAWPGESPLPSPEVARVLRGRMESYRAGDARP